MSLFTIEKLSTTEYTHTLKQHKSAAKVSKDFLCKAIAATNPIVNKALKEDYSYLN